jgi:hypothetical protein
MARWRFNGSSVSGHDQTTIIRIGDDNVAVGDEFEAPIKDIEPLLDRFDIERLDGDQPNPPKDVTIQAPVAKVSGSGATPGGQ